MLRVLYLVPNLADPAVGRRIGMLKTGGAEIAAAGFRRSGVAMPDLPVTHAIELGETFDARFAQRIMAVVGAAMSIVRRLGHLAPPDVIVARNLEMLPLAGRLKAHWGGHVPIVYECLDIHRLLLRPDLIGQAMRGAERRWAQPASLLMTSSPAFISNHLGGLGPVPSLLVENKVPHSAERGSNPALGPADGGPVKIGWFGALRCRRSLDALASFSRAMSGRVQVILRGRPALNEFEDFHGFVEAEPFLRFEGAYRNPDDLASIYSDVHLAWAIDFFEAGKNSQWLLPNRIYEGSFHGAIPVTLAGTETAAFTERLGIGITVPDIEAGTLASALGELDAPRLHRLASAVLDQDPANFSFHDADCRQLVERLQQLGRATQPEQEAA
ncbi:glycosyl transferase family 1 [Devosia yakushimensis]|uniref:Glycosyl transferase family 1 n=1 Tax=Devosia yakushimensis TaxID=470028 RepID=A0ABQ5UBS7_9HYPH|nr:glycosyl transferase family 1 [Devosia yakushimensis]GLQ09301.1 glycosyl transferase family 1 [Devosia yakushimensis]